MMIQHLLKHLTTHRRLLAGLLVLALLGLLTWANPTAPLSRAGDTLADLWRRLDQAAAPPAYALAEGRPLGQGGDASPSGSGTTTSINAVARRGDILYVGGSFEHLELTTGPGVPLDATGTPLPGFPQVNSDGIVYAAVPDGSGGWYIGGAFTQVGGLARDALAHILPDLSVDPAWNPGADGPIFTLAISGSTVYAGGWFTHIGGQNRNKIAALDADSGSATPWNPNANGSVQTLAISGSTVYAGGTFDTIGGESRNRLAALDTATGNATGWNPGADGQVNTLAISGSTVYAGGWFTHIGGQNRNYIAALEATSGNAAAWNPNANGSVSTLAISGSTVYAGGWFTTIDGQPRNYIAALEAGSGSAALWNPNANARVSTLAISGNTVYAGGKFTTIGGESRNYIAALEADSGSAAAWNPNANGSVQTLAISGSTVYAGGAFSTLGGESRSNIAALEAATGRILPWNPGADASVSTLVISGSTVYAGGDFTTIGGQSRNNLAALDAASGSVLPWDPDSNHWVNTLAISGSTVYAGGWFTTIGGESRNYSAALDAATGHATPWDPNASRRVYTLAISGSTVYAGGDFTTIDGQSRNYIAALEAASGSVLPWHPNAGGSMSGSAGTVGTLAVSGSTVYAGGEFTTIGGQSRNHLAALDRVTGRAAAWNPNADSTVHTLAISGSTVYAGGEFTTIGGQSGLRWQMAQGLAAFEVSAPGMVVLGNGQVIDPGATVPAAANQTDFGEVTLGQSLSHTLTISNRGSADLIVTTLSLAGANPTDFSLGGLALPATVTANSSVTFELTFSPTLAGDRAATVSIAHNDSGRTPYQFAVRGTGLADGGDLLPTIAVLGNGQIIDSGAAVPAAANHTDFGEVTLGQSLSHTLTISNSGSADLTVSSINLTGANPTDFSLEQIALPATVTINSSVTFDLAFRPSLTGTRVATVSIAHNDSGRTPYEFAVRGTGLSSAGGSLYFPLIFKNASSNIGRRETR